MIYLKKSNIKKGNLTMITRRTFDVSMYTEEEKVDMAKTGVFVESLPPLEVPDNHTYMLYVDENDMPVYVYEELPKDNELEALKKQNEELTSATIDLADTVAFQSAKLREQEEALIDLANTLAEVMG